MGMSNKLIGIVITALSMITACGDADSKKQSQALDRVENKISVNTRQNKPSPLEQIKKRLPIVLDVDGTVLSDIQKDKDSNIILTYTGKDNLSDKLKQKIIKTHAICEMFNDDLMRGANLIVDYSNSKQQKGVITINHYDCTHEFNTIMAKNPRSQVLDSRYEQVYQDALRQQTLANAKARALAEEAKYQAQQSYQRQQELYNQMRQQTEQQSKQYNPPSYVNSNQNNSAMSDYCSKPVAGARGMTAKQAQLCFGGGSGGGYESGYSAPAPSTPRHIANCDGAGCNGTDGNRYNSTGDGQNFYDSQGRFCQNIGGQMQCH